MLIVGWALATSVSAAEEHVAIFKNVSGAVNVMRGDTQIKATGGMPLHRSDTVRSAADASGGIAFKDGTLLTLGPSTELSIRDYVFEPKASQYAFSVYLARGSAIYSSGKIGKLAPDAVRVDTPRAAVGVRGTRFIVHAE
ncbi:MAG: FecR domain-containing protein [Burkholderiales bacterium]|nr:FecR domain-containing protein [Burkholderiales bacterium]